MHPAGNAWCTAETHVVAAVVAAHSTPVMATCFFQEVYGAAFVACTPAREADLRQWAALRWCLPWATIRAPVPSLVTIRSPMRACLARATAVVTATYAGPARAEGRHP